LVYVRRGRLWSGSLALIYLNVIGTKRSLIGDKILRVTKIECDEYNDQLNQLFPLLQCYGAFWTGLAQNLDWLLIDHKHSEDLKIKVANPEEKLFVKVYSSKTEQYPLAVFAALVELSELKLSTPVLSPQVVCRGAIIFELGEVVRDVAYGELYSKSEQKMIEVVVEKHGLKPLYPLMKIGIVSVNGVHFSVDPFQDDMSSIFDFVNQD
jgi:hypothetical protein